MRYEFNSKHRNSFDDKTNGTEQHPVWRGIGFLIMLIIPIVSFGLAEIVLDNLKENVRGFVVPALLRTGSIQITSNWSVVDLWAVIVIALVLVFLLLTIFVLVNTLVFGLTKNKKKNIFEADKKEFKKSKRKSRNR